MKFLMSFITIFMIMFYLPVIEMKSKRCHKHPNPVRCLSQPTLSCGNWSMTFDLHGITVGSIGKLSCPLDHTLRGNDTISCLESGLWSRIKATCVPDDVTDSRFALFQDSRYYFVKAELQTFPQAEATCLDMCATLVEINNEAENNFLLSKAESLGLVSPWIGLESKDGTRYTWVSGNTTQTNSYDDWSHPGTIIYEAGRCVVLDVGYKAWFSRDSSYCDSTKDEFICEFQI